MLLCRLGPSPTRAVVGYDDKFCWHMRPFARLFRNYKGYVVLSISSQVNHLRILYLTSNFKPSTMATTETPVPQTQVALGGKVIASTCPKNPDGLKRDQLMSECFSYRRQPRNRFRHCRVLPFQWRGQSLFDRHW